MQTQMSQMMNSLYMSRAHPHWAANCEAHIRLTSDVPPAEFEENSCKTGTCPMVLLQLTAQLEAPTHPPPSRTGCSPAPILSLTGLPRPSEMPNTHSAVARIKYCRVQKYSAAMEFVEKTDAAMDDAKASIQRARNSTTKPCLWLATP